MSHSLGQHVFDASLGRLCYEQDGGRTWVVTWRKLVFAELPTPRSELLAELLARAGIDAPRIPPLGNEARHEVLRLLGCATSWRPELGGFVAATDDTGRTSVPDVLVSGPEVFGSEIPPEAWPFLESLPAICPCEGVPLAAIERVAAEAGRGLRTTKVHTRAGAGAGCQGAFCRTPILLRMQGRHDHRPELETPPAQRFPLIPVTIRHWLDAAEETKS